MIPKIIWQTYKDRRDSLAPYMNEAIQTWQDLNPDYKIKYMDDEQAAKFILDKFGMQWHNIFINCPVGVMRGDLWRYLIIYEYGGVYADLDTHCLKPIDEWLNQDYDMIVCPENDIHFCQWTFAAAPGNPIIKSVLDQIKKAFENPDYDQDHFVHKLTGPAIWTEGILKALDITVENLISDSDLLNSCDNAKLYKFFCYGKEDWRIFHFEAVKHLYGSQSWKDGQYVQWIEDDLVKKRKFFT